MNPIACIRYALCLLAAFACFGLETVAHAQTTFTVNYPGDDSDTNAGDGTCDTGVDPAGPASVGCSLRAALQEANALAGADTVHFSIATLFFSECGSESDGTCTLAPASALPAISEALYIDGETQPGATCGANFTGRDLRIVLDGTSVANDGLRVNVDNSVVRGLVIHSFTNHGIDIDASGTRVSCMHIGTDVTGMTDLGNGGDGILVGPLSGNPGADAFIGTNSDGVDDEEEWNLISGNGGYGIRSNKPNSIIAGNFIGVNAAISATLGNDLDGIHLKRDGRIGVAGDGVADLAERNVIGGNGGHGINVDVSDDTGFDDVDVRGNFIGTDTTSTIDLGNTLDGFSSNFGGGTIGSNLDENFDDLEANVIAFNGENGIVTVTGFSFPSAYKVHSNSIFSNGLLGFDILDDGANANDAGDVNSQGTYQNYPEIQSAIVGAGELNIRYLVDTDTVWLPQYWPLRVEFFKADADQEEGKTYLGFDTYDKTEWHSCGSPPCTVGVTLTTDLSIGDTLVATATGHTTSEFSPPYATESINLVVNATTDEPDLVAGDGVCDTGESASVNCSLRAAIEEANAFAGPDTITFAIVPALAETNCGGPGICGIVPDSTLPAITDTVAIFGWTQSGAACRELLNGHALKIVLNGANVTGSGLTVDSGADGSIISGLNIQEFSGNGITVGPADDVHIACNFIGTNVFGTSAIANGGDGIAVGPADGTVIGTNGDGPNDAIEWNLISGNGGAGISHTIGAGSMVVAGNAIGIAAGGTALGNGGAGVTISAGLNNRVGTDGDGVSDALETNFITANGGYGVSVSDIGTGAVIAGNYIGTRIDGAAGLGNTLAGVHIGNGPVGIRIGTDLNGSGDDDEGNTIAFNGTQGILLTSGNPGNEDKRQILGNSIFSNVGIGIDLEGDGPTANDPGDNDGTASANKLQNYPDIASVEVDGPDAGITYTVDSDTSFVKYPLTVEFFLADADQEEGKTFVARDTLEESDWHMCGSPPCNKTVVFVGAGVAVGDTLVATATDDLGNTSEFSMPVEAVEAPPPPEGVALHVRAFLEGAYFGGVMSTALKDNDYVPLSQPFSHPKFNGTELNYDSTQTVGALPDSTVDWVLVSLRTATGPETEVAGSQFAALISENGTVASTGEDSLRFVGITGGSYYLVVRARNHADVMSSSAIDATDGTGSWDFTTASSHAYGTTPMKSLSGGAWGLYAADGNADGAVTAPDFNIWNAATSSGATGYEQSDYNMDGIVTAPDFNLWNANTTAGAASGVPD